MNLNISQDMNSGTPCRIFLSIISSYDWFQPWNELIDDELFLRVSSTNELKLDGNVLQLKHENILKFETILAKSCNSYWKNKT